MIRIQLIKLLHNSPSKWPERKFKSKSFSALLFQMMMPRVLQYTYDGIKIEKIYDACHIDTKIVFFSFSFSGKSALCVLSAGAGVFSEANRMQNEKHFDRNTTVIYCFHSFVI